MRRAGRPRHDARVAKTRAALLNAFFELFTAARAYEDITVQELARRAAVGRSTLYEHFGGKDGVLAASLARPFGVLADSIEPRDNTVALGTLLQHFWHNRARGRTLFEYPMHTRTVAVLRSLIEERLRRRPASERARLGLPPRLAAVQLSEALIAPIAAWMTGETACTPQRLARALRASAQALTVCLSQSRSRR